MTTGLMSQELDFAQLNYESGVDLEASLGLSLDWAKKHAQKSETLCI